MSLVIVVLILLVWAVRGIKEALTPPIEDLDAHLKYIMSLPDEKARQKYLKHRKPGDL